MKLYNMVGKLEVFIAKYSLLVMTLLVFLSAMSRRIGHPISWAVDVSTFLFAWAVFLGADAALRRDKLVSIDLLVEKFPQKIQRAIKLANYFIMSVFLILMVYYGIKLSISTYHRTFAGLPGLSYSYVTIAVPIGCLLMLTTIIVKIKEFLGKGVAE